ncbi:glutathione S-transferase [Acinetobacter sp. MD2(2019)]|uniref:glutathione S-transferase family protein n=1 Tax=Acinetobacter sp. MD2(2019) TaxID=2605273 RepID=UPI002D1E67FE|nr:glutathione S-transferase [Acinetobacter sp. MD2(2019)]MEB3753871.1 glutathione S-transferase [Acinetobacter sp. MD2(2019)]
MIVLHHLNQSRSLRILWLLEEMQQPYELKVYKRNALTRLAPEELKNIHPLGKSPVIELDGKVIAESGAIVELLIEKFAAHLAPERHEEDYIDYLQWIHFAESSAMVPYLLKIFNSIETQKGTELCFLDSYADAEFNKVFGYLESTLENKTFLVGNRLTGADFMLGFVAHGLVYGMKLADKFPNIHQYLKNLEALPSWQRALKIEAECN